MKFKDKEMQEKLEELNEQGLSYAGLVADLNIARTALLRMIAEEEPDDKVAWAKDVANIVSQISRAGEQLLRTAEKLRLVLTREELMSFTDRWVDSWRNAVVEVCGEDAFVQIVDRWRPVSQEFLAI